MAELSNSTTYADIEARARQAALEALAVDGPVAAARTAIAVADAAMADALLVSEVAEAVQGAHCKAGCGWCCHQVVGITAAEEELVVEAVTRLSAEVRARVQQRHVKAACALGGKPVSEWQAARMPCPLLDDGLCAIHADRPLPCRAVLSADASACRSWFEGTENARIPLVAAQRRVYSSAQAGLAQALAASGIPPGPVSLVEALSLAFQG